MNISIVVCAHNEERSIGSLLNNLLNQKLPPEVLGREMIVVASGCTDNTVEIVRNQMKRGEKSKLIEEKRRLGKASALNKAFKVSTGDYIVLVPADVYPAEDALFNLLIPFRDKNVSAVSGRPMQDPRKGRSGLSGYLANLTYRLWGRLMTKLNDKHQAAHCSGEFMAIRKDVKTQVPEESAADDAYIAILAKRKGLIKFAHEAICYNLMPSRLADYINQRRRWLYGHFQTKKLAGEYPKVLDTVIFSNPTVAIQVLVDEITEKPRDTGYLTIAVIIEALIYCLSIIDHILHRQYAIWPVIKSTKYA